MRTKTSEKNSGIVSCLGWCGKSFLSRDKIAIRFCEKCREKRNSEMNRGIKTKKCSLELSDD